MDITYFGHSCFQVVVQGKKILFDPFISPNPLAASIDIKSIRPDYILISHGHADHTADALSIAQNSGALLIGAYEVTEWFKKQGLEKVHPMNTGGKWMLDCCKVKCVSAVHSSSMPDGSYGGAAMGFVIESAEKNFYYAGDTALTYDMKLIGEYRQLDFAFLPIGDNFTMSVDNALIAADFINCSQIIGMHFDTFGYIKIDHEESVEKFTRSGKKLILPTIGETFSL
jgi:L-ascorbate metabolism protein UlaG (beta-lactamase superfamily)